MLLLLDVWRTSKNLVVSRKKWNLNALIAIILHHVGTIWSATELAMKERKSLDAIYAIFLLAGNVKWVFIQAASIVTHQQHLFK